MKKLMFLAVSASLPLLALQTPPTSLEVEVGARLDKVHFDVLTNGATAKYHFDNIQSWEVGLRGHWQLDCHWYARGNINYAGTVSADSNINSLEAPLVKQTGSATGHLLDMEIILGRFFCLTQHIAIAPVIGWGYDGQYLCSTDMAAYTFKQLQNGAIFGFDVHSQWTPRFSLDLGYELHITSSRAKVKFPSSAALATIRGHTKFTYGQLGWIEALYRFACCWQVGLRGEVLSFNTTKPGSLLPTAQSPDYTGARCGKISWQSAQLSVLLGYSF